MKSYDKIEYWNSGPFGEKCLAFQKEDGSNFRAEWGYKRGFYKFGTRREMIDRSNETFGSAIDIFLNKYADDLERVFRTKYPKTPSFVVFGEFFGENSFSGQHVSSDTKDVLMFDVNQYQKGIISPYEFLDNFGHIEVPKLIYDGDYNMEFIIDVMNNKYDLKEGVVCKGLTKTKKQSDIIWMTKVKTKEWLEKVKNKLGEKALLEELNNDKKLLNYLN